MTEAEAEDMRLLRAQLGAMTRALLRAHEQFLLYAKQHAAKKTELGEQRAKVNIEMAEMCAAALRVGAPARQPSN